MKPKHTIPIACELPEDERPRCAEALKSTLFSHVEELHERPGGYSLRMPWDAERIRELGEFLALDSSCCPFLDHSMEIPRGKEVVWLHLTGPDDAQKVLTEELERVLPESVHARLQDDSTTPFARRKPRIAWPGAGMVGVTGLLCCAAPGVGLTALAAGVAGMGSQFDPFWVVGFTLGAMSLGWLALRRSKAQRSACR